MSSEAGTRGRSPGPSCWPTVLQRCRDSLTPPSGQLLGTLPRFWRLFAPFGSEAVCLSVCSGAAGRHPRWALAEARHARPSRTHADAHVTQARNTRPIAAEARGAGRSQAGFCRPLRKGPLTLPRCRALGNGTRGPSSHTRLLRLAQRTSRKPFPQRGTGASASPRPAPGHAVPGAPVGPAPHSLSSPGPGTTLLAWGLDRETHGGSSARPPPVLCPPSPPPQRL